MTHPHPDPFKEARAEAPVLQCPFRGEPITMILRHEDVRKSAKDWQTFSSDAPFRVPIPSEEDVRTMRQLPIETDPPEHTEYRAIAEPFFKRAKDPGMIARVEALIDRLLDEALSRDTSEIVHEFALPLQSHALTYLLNVPESEAETWIGWGIHVFRVRDGLKPGTELEEYLHRQFDRAEAAPGEDFFSALVQAEFRGRRLTREEVMGFANLAFAGGRDTIIHTVSNIFAYLSGNPAALDFLREDPGRAVHASEEFFRVYIPLTHIGRVCPADTEVGGVTVPAGQRVSLCWSSANRDETVFEDADEIRLDRKPNPHLAFGFGTHLCLGAPHARLLVRTLLQKIAGRVSAVEVLDCEERIEREEKYERVVGYDSLRVRLSPLGAK
ncbi:MAG: cytochrome P450 [Verrucomicrobiales bacterium]|nr:cytochrome P450 [Verrucomicrobiales bacterium]